jgi:hypothetical protein
MGVTHRSLWRLLTTHEADFAEMGSLRFEIAVVSNQHQGGGVKPRYAMLDEDQAYLLAACVLTLVSATAWA